MTTAPISLQELQRRRDVKAKAAPSWRFWGLDVHVCTRETLREAYRRAQANNGAPGMDGVTFEDIEASGVEPCLAQIWDALVTRTYRPRRLRQQASPKAGGTKVRVLSMPTIRDRGVQGARKPLLEPLFAADCQPGSYGYRPKRSVHDAVLRVAEAMGQAAGKKGVAQGGVFSPLRSHLSLTAGDRMLARATEVTPCGPYTSLADARFADDRVILVDAYPQHEGLLKAVDRLRLRHRTRETSSGMSRRVGRREGRPQRNATALTKSRMGHRSRRVGKPRPPG
ncbi:MAG TPA: hypothetical protein VI542_29095 [Candidatus Tectomicrobia bacterium]